MDHRLPVESEHIIVFLHEVYRFEVWLSGKNKQVLGKYWNILKESKWEKYKMVFSEKGIDSILEHILVEDPNFGDLDALTTQIEVEKIRFITEVERFLEKCS